MTPESLLAHFDALADTAGAIPKLRSLILRWAEQGQLVTQDAADTPAEHLLQQIARDRATSARDMGITRLRTLPRVEDTELPFPTPQGWSWARMGELARAQAGFAFASSAFVQGGSGVPIIRIRDIASDRTQVNYVGDYRDEFLVQPNDYLVGMDGNFNVARWRGPKALLNQRVTRLQWYSSAIQQSFFATALQHRLRALQGTKAYTTVDHLSTRQIEEAVVPVPPLAEQKRIVAKVDELMALCDRLEAQQQEREHAHAALAHAALARFADAPTADNLEYLFHTNYSVDPAALRQALLMLAFRGGLCAQVPEDGDARDALELMILEAKRTTTRRDRIARADRESDVIAPHPIPASWTWTTLGTIGGWGSGSTPPRENQDLYGGGMTWLKSGELNDNQALRGSSETVSESAIEQGSFRQNQPGDVLFAMYGATVGKVAILAEPAVTNQAVCGCTPCRGVVNTFLFYYLVSERESFRSASAGAAQPNFSKDKILTYPFPLPPLAEQRRIVAKVNDLTALVDRLEGDLAAARDTGEKLMDAVVAELCSK